MKLLIVQATRCPTNARLVCGDWTVRRGVAVTRQPVRSDKVRRLYRNSSGMAPCFACDLTQQDVIARRCCEHMGRPDLAAGQICERKRHDDHVAGYKSRHASSSSAESQSCDQAVAAKGSRLACAASSTATFEISSLRKPASRDATSLCFWSTGRTLAACSISANVLI